MKLRFCHECTAPLTKETDTLYVCSNGHFFYNSPVGAAAAILVNEHGEVLFSKRGGDPQKDKYDFPGGFLLFGEAARDGVQRELIEEAGVTLTDFELLASVCNVYRENYTTCDHVFLCTAWDGEPVAADDVAAFEWHPLEFMLGPEFAFPAAFTPLYDTIKAKLNERTMV